MSGPENNFDRLEVYDTGVTEVVNLLEQAFSEANLSHEDVSALAQLSQDQVSALLLDGDITVPDLAVLLAYTGKRLNLLSTSVENIVDDEVSYFVPVNKDNKVEENPSLSSDDISAIAQDDVSYREENTADDVFSSNVLDDVERDNSEYFETDDEAKEDNDEGALRLVSWSVNDKGEEEHPSLSVGNETIMLTPPVLSGILSGLQKLDSDSREPEVIKARRSPSDVFDSSMRYWGKHKISGTAGIIFLGVALFVVLYGFIVTGTA